MNIIERLARADTITLKSGRHRSPDHGLCVMEAEAWLHELEHTDCHPCICPVIGAGMRAWNDTLPTDADRERLLRPFLGRLAGSKSTPEVEKQRSYLAIDWLVREFLPAWLETVDELRSHAVAVRSLPHIADLDDLDACASTLRAAERAARRVTGSATGSAAWNAAWSATGSAVWRVTGSAAWNAAERAAGSTAWSAARSATRRAAWRAAERALTPTVAKLQSSSVDLFERMLKIQAAEE